MALSAHDARLSGRNVKCMFTTVIRNTWYFLVSSVGQKFLAFLYFTLLARTLGPEDTGKYMLALSLTALFAVAMDLGLSPVITREAVKSPEAIKCLLPRIIRFKIFVSCAVIPGIIGVGYFLGYHQDQLLLIGLASLVMVGDSLHMSVYALLRARQQFVYEARGMVISKMLVLLVGVPLLIFHAPLYLLMMALFTGTLFHVVYSFWALQKYTERPKDQVSFFSLTPLLKQGIPFAVASLCTTAWISLDSVFLSIFHGASEVGLFSVPSKMVFALQFIPVALSAAWYPAIVCTTDRTSFASAFQASLRYLWLLAFPTVVGTILLAPDIMYSIFGVSYSASVPALQIAIMSLPLYWVNLQIGSVLAGTHRQKLHATIIAIATGVSVGMNLIFIPLYGTKAAAYAMVISSLVFFILGMYAAHRTLHFAGKAWIIPLFHIGVACAGMALVVLMVKTYMPLVATVVLGAGTYGALLLALKEVTPQEVKNMIARIV